MNYDEVIKVQTEAAQTAFLAADEAGCSLDECWRVSQVAAFRAMQDMMPEFNDVELFYGGIDLAAMARDCAKVMAWNDLKTLGRGNDQAN